MLLMMCSCHGVLCFDEFVHFDICNYVADLEDGEILTAVKIEPHTSDDEDCRHASVGRHKKRFFTSSPPRNCQADHNDDRFHLGVDGVDNVSAVRVRPSSDVTSPVTRSTKRRRTAKVSTSPGQPGSSDASSYPPSKPA